LFKNLNTPKDVFEEIKKVSKNRLCDYSGMSYKLIEELGGVQWPCNKQNPKGTKRLYTKDMPFCFSDGKAKLLAVDWINLSEKKCKDFPLILNTGRCVEHFHTRTKTGSIGILNNLAPRAWVEINSADAKKLKVKRGDLISISSKRGKVSDIVVKVTQTIKEGTIFVPFHFNKQLVNLLVIDDFDSKSFEPNFKQSAVQLHSSGVPSGIELKEPKIMGAIAYSEVKKSSKLIKQSTTTNIKEDTLS